MGPNPTLAAEEATLARHLYPLAPAKAGEPPTFLLDVSDIAELEDSVRWAEEAKTLCEQWHPIIVRFLATEGWTPPKEIKLVFKKELKAPAYATGSSIFVNEGWIRANRDDFGCVIHELTHVIQAYPPSRNSPGWLVEGLADYIRFWKYEPEVPRPHIDRKRSKYQDGYRTTGAFLAWIAMKYDKRIIRRLDQSLRDRNYSEAIFAEVTGRSLDALWEEFVAQ